MYINKFCSRKVYITHINCGKRGICTTYMWQLEDDYTKYIQKNPKLLYRLTPMKLHNLTSVKHPTIIIIRFRIAIIPDQIDFCILQFRVIIISPQSFYAIIRGSGFLVIPPAFIDT